jgi:hypothetical protein
VDAAGPLAWRDADEVKGGGGKGGSSSRLSKKVRTTRLVYGGRFFGSVSAQDSAFRVAEIQEGFHLFICLQAFGLSVRTFVEAGWQNLSIGQLKMTRPS